MRAPVTATNDSIARKTALVGGRTIPDGGRAQPALPALSPVTLEFTNVHVEATSYIVNTSHAGSSEAILAQIHDAAPSHSIRARLCVGKCLPAQADRCGRRSSRQRASFVDQSVQQVILCPVWQSWPVEGTNRTMANSKIGLLTPQMI
jgi:hypothetical protein